MNLKFREAATMGTHTLFIPERMCNLNDFISYNRCSKYKGNNVKKETEFVIRACIRKQMAHLEIYRPVIMVCTWHELNRMRDPDNICFAKKFILDALVDSGVLRNDGWSQISGFKDRFKVDRKNVGVLVELIEIENGDIF